MKLRLPNKLVAAIMAAASPVLFQTLSTVTLGAAAVTVGGSYATAASLTLNNRTQLPAPNYAYTSSVTLSDGESLTLNLTANDHAGSNWGRTLSTDVTKVNTVSGKITTTGATTINLNEGSWYFSGTSDNATSITGTTTITGSNAKSLTIAQLTGSGNLISQKTNGDGGNYRLLQLTGDNSAFTGTITLTNNNSSYAGKNYLVVSHANAISNASVVFTENTAANARDNVIALNVAESSVKNITGKGNLVLAKNANLDGYDSTVTAATLNLTGTNSTFNGTIDAGVTLKIAEGASLNLSGGSLASTATLNTTAGKTTVTGAFTAGGVIEAGTSDGENVGLYVGDGGTLTLNEKGSGQSYIHGYVTVQQGGTLVLRHDSTGYNGGANSVQKIVVDAGGKLQLGMNNTNDTFTGTLVLNGTLEMADVFTGGRLDLYSKNNCSAKIQVSEGQAGTVAAGVTLELRETDAVFDIADNATLTVNGILNKTTSGEGNQSFKKTGAGAMVLSNANNTYTGVTSIANGALIAANSTAVATSSEIKFADLPASEAAHRVLAFVTGGTYNSETGELTGGERIDGTIKGLSGNRGTVVAKTLTVDVASGTKEFLNRYDTAHVVDGRTTDAAVLDVNKLIKTGAGTQVIGGEYTATLGYENGLVITDGIDVQGGTLHLKTRGVVTADFDVQAGAVLKTTDDNTNQPSAENAVKYDGKITLHGTDDNMGKLTYTDGSTYTTGGIAVDGYGEVDIQWAKQQHVQSLSGNNATLALVRTKGEKAGQEGDANNGGYLHVYEASDDGFSGTIKLTNLTTGNEDGGLVMHNNSGSALADTVIDFTGEESSDTNALLAFLPGDATYNSNKKLTNTDFAAGSVAGLKGNKGVVKAGILTFNTADTTEYTYGGTLNVAGVTKTGSGSQSLNSTSSQSLGAVCVTDGALKIATNATATTLSITGGTLDIAAEKRFALTTTTSGDKDYSGVTGSGTFAVALQSGGASIVSKLTLGSSFGGTLEVSGNLNSLSTLGGTANVQFNNGSALVFAHTKGRNDETLVGGVDDFSKAINIADGATFTIYTWGDNSNTNDNRISGAITGTANTTLQKGDTGKLTLNGDLSNFKGTLKASNGTLVIDNVDGCDYSMEAISLNGGNLELAGGTYTVGGSNNTQGLFEGNGKLTVKSGAAVTVNAHRAAWQFELREGDDRGVSIEHGGSFTVDWNGSNLKVTSIAEGQTAKITTTRTGKNAYIYSGDGSDKTTIANANVEFKTTEATNFSNKLQNTSFTNKGTADITLTNGENTLTAVHAEKGNVVVAQTNLSADTLKSVKAEGGDVTLQNLTAQTGLSLNELVIGNSKTVSALTDGSIAVNAQESNVAAISIAADGKLTAGVGAKLNANLTMQSGSTTSMANNSSLNMGCALTLNKGMNLDSTDGTADSMSTLKSVLATGYDTRWLYTAVDSLTLVDFNGSGNDFVLTDANIDTFNGIDASTYFNNLTSGVYFLTAVANEQQGGWDIGITAPEPTTATLSLLALAGLAARRRRK